MAINNYRQNFNPIDLVELRTQIRSGILKVFISKKCVYIKDPENDECVMICDLRVGEQND